jgi:iron(III) transport system ATP-binding protein
MNPSVNNSLALRLDGVSHSFGAVDVLKDVSLQVPTGHITAVLGPSGVGKTTLLRVVSGFETPTSGTIEIGGRVVVRDGRSLVEPEQRGVALVPQEGALFPHLSVGENVAFGLPKRRSAQARARVNELLELVGLGGFADRRPEELSGGMQQRVALARALAPSPAIVLLDEPFSALDASLKMSVRDQVVAALRATGASAMWVTHDQQEALSTADRVAVMLDNTITQCSEPAQLYSHPVSRRVAEFVGEAVKLVGNVEADGTVTCALGRLPLNGTAPRGIVTVIVRPEQIELDESPNAPHAGTTISTRFYGHDGEIDVRLDSGETVVARLHATRLPRSGDRVHLAVSGQVLAFA